MTLYLMGMEAKRRNEMDVEKMTFYKVTYAVWGADYPNDKYFDTKEAAYEFYYNTDFCDKPKAITVRKPSTIALYKKLVSGNPF